MNPHPLLTPREQQVAASTAEGLSDKQIAERLGIAVNTVKQIAKHIHQKLKLENRVQVALWWLRHTRLACEHCGGMRSEKAGPAHPDRPAH